MQPTMIRVTNEAHRLFGEVFRILFETNAGFHVRAHGEFVTIDGNDAVRCVEAFC